jgi:hypothetical protein
MSRSTAIHWFDFADLVCVAAAVILLEVFPQWGGWPLLVAIVPWVARLAARKPLIQPTPFDLALIIFLLTAAVGIWAAYQPQAAWLKFWLLVSAVLLYFAVACQSQENLRIFAGFLVVIGISVAVVYLLAWNWEAHPAKLPVVNQWMLSWMKIRPDFPWMISHPNEDDTAGMAALTLPFLAAFSWTSWRRRNVVLLMGSAAALILILFTLLITTSRGAWVAGGATLGSLGLWLVTRAIFKANALRARGVFVSTLVLSSVFFGVVLVRYPTLAIRTANLLPGPAEMGSRLELGRNAIEIIRDYPFTGGGLAGFAGQYSQYVLRTPYYFIGYSHNIFLDSAVEQGVLGSLALIWVLVGSLWLILSPRANGQDSWSASAVLASLLFQIFYGLPENIISTVQTTPLLFVLPGMVVAVTRPAAGVPQPVFKRWKPLAASLTASLLFLVFIFNQPVQAAWYANLGAMQMSKIELANFPAGQWTGKDSSNMSGARVLFEQALQKDPSNPTANYRLGLLALDQQDFPSAVNFLETAFRGAPQHRGIQKSLGVSYAWNGQLSAANTVLSDITDAGAEMEVYSWWWGQQGRPDLAQNAGIVAAELAAGR